MIGVVDHSNGTYYYPIGGVIVNVLEKVLEALEKRVNFRKALIKYEKRMGTITDVTRNQGALEELVVIANIIDSSMKKVNDDWIPCSERLPEENDSVLMCSTTGCRDVGWWTGKRWVTGFLHADVVKDIIAWQPLPEPYKGA